MFETIKINGNLQNGIDKINSSSHLTLSIYLKDTTYFAYFNPIQVTLLADQSKPSR